MGACYLRAQTRTGELSLRDAAQSVVEKHPLVHYQELQTQIDRGLLREAAAPFDTMISSGASQLRVVTPLTQAEREQYALIGVQGSDEVSDMSNLDLSVSRLYRSGISIAGSITLARDVDTIVNPDGINSSDPTISVTIPLLRGRGRKAVDSSEAAFAREVEASTFDLTFQVSTLLFNAANDYWNLVAAQKLAAIQKEAEGRAATDLENTQILVNADRLPKENLNEVNANVAQGASARIAAEQAMVAAEYQLAMDIGMDRQEIASTVLKATEDFPAFAPAESQPPTAAKLMAYIDDALSNRSDLIALNVRIHEEQIHLAADKNALLPQLNMTITAGYNSLQEGRRLQDFLNSPGGNVDGPNAAGSLTYSYPPRKDAARGAYLQAVSTEGQLEAQRAQLSHSIVSAVITAAQAVHNAVLEVTKATTAVAFYKKSLDGQREKYHLGMASVVDVLTVENSLTAAMITEVQAELSYALALTQFRFATGTIVPPGKQVVSVDSAVFRTLPPV